MQTVSPWLTTIHHGRLLWHTPPAETWNQTGNGRRCPKRAGKLSEIARPIARSRQFSNRVTANSMFVHLFTTKRSELKRRLSILRDELSDNGTIWVSWPKKSSGISTDVTEDVIREIALPLGFVDIKVCAVDEIWSGLKLRIRCENRRLPSPHSSP